MDTRRKITFYLNPETNEADRFVCQKTDETPQGKGTFMARRAAYRVCFWKAG